MAEALMAGRGQLAPVGERGVFEGYASLFNVADSAGDVVVPGAFAASLARRGPGGIRMLFQHDPSQPVGTWIELREDARGLFVRGRLAAEVQKAEELARLLQENAIDGLSIGFRAVLATRDRLTRQRRLVKIDLWEISLVTFPMLDGKAPGTGRTEARHALRSPGGHALRAKALSRSAWSRRAPGPNRALGPRWACRAHTRDIRPLGHYHASEPRNGRVWPRVGLVLGGIEPIDAAGGRSRP